jgi:uncharacterized protein YecE (DUF72 family)
MQNLHLGTIGWSYNFWKGPFYPQKTPSKDFLTYYSSKFDTVEVDNTFYRIPSEQAVTKWKNQTPEGFLFSFKFHTHQNAQRMRAGNQSFPTKNCPAWQQIGRLAFAVSSKLRN